MAVAAGESATEIGAASAARMALIRFNAAAIMSRFNSIRSNGTPASIAMGISQMGPGTATATPQNDSREIHCAAKSSSYIKQQ